MPEDAMVVAAEEFERAAEELEAAARHMRIAAQHFRDANVPRACAHAFAGYGHVRRAQEHVDHRAMIHAEKSQA